MIVRGQAGTALVICLVLLTVLTLLATSTMSTATLQLTMAGNDQFTARAFEAAEAGIASGIAEIASRPPSVSATLTGTLNNADTYAVTVIARGAFPPPRAYLPTFIASHYEIQSTGHSLRDATASHLQGVFIVQPPAVSVSGQATPPLCLTGVEIRPHRCVNIGTAIRTYWRPLK